MAEKRNLAIGNYRITWSGEDYDTLVATLRIEETGITCLTVTGGSCNQSTPPGLTIDGWMFTGYLKPIPITKSELIAELGKRGAIDLSQVSTVSGDNRWFVYGGQLMYQLAGMAKAITILNINERNPPTQVSDITLVEAGQEVNELAKSWVLEQLAKLPYPIGVKITKSELIAELGKKGAIDLSQVSTVSGDNKWYYVSGMLAYVGTQKRIVIRNIQTRNPPTEVADIQFIENRTYVNELGTEWVLARLAELSYGAAPEKKTVTFDSAPAGATVTIAAL